MKRQCKRAIFIQSILQQSLKHLAVEVLDLHVVALGDVRVEVPISAVTTGVHSWLILKQ